MRVIVDWVPNHTSAEHPWFVESRSSRDNPKRDWYIWRDGPNNWKASFGGRRLDLRRRHRPVVPPPLPAVPTGSQLAQPRGRRGHARHPAVLAGPGRGRVPHRRRPGPGQGSRVPGRPGWAGHPPLRGQRLRRRPRHPPRLPAGGRGVRRRQAAGGRGVPAVDPSGRSILRARRRAAPGLRLHVAVRPVGRGRLAPPAATCGRRARRDRGVADVEPVEPRQPPPAHPVRRVGGPGPGRGGAAAHRAGHAVPLQRRGAGPRGRRRAGRPGGRPGRSGRRAGRRCRGTPGPPTAGGPTTRGCHGRPSRMCATSIR